MERHDSIGAADNLDGSSPASTTVFGLGGAWYAIDLSEHNRDRLHAVLAPFIAAGRPVTKNHAFTVPDGLDEDERRAFISGCLNAALGKTNEATKRAMQTVVSARHKLESAGSEDDRLQGARKMIETSIAAVREAVSSQDMSIDQTEQTGSKL